MFAESWTEKASRMPQTAWWRATHTSRQHWPRRQHLLLPVLQHITRQSHLIFLLDQSIVRHTKPQYINFRTPTVGVYLQDLESGLYHLLYVEVTSHRRIRGEAKTALTNFVNILSKVERPALYSTTKFSLWIVHRYMLWGFSTSQATITSTHS